MHVLPLHRGSRISRILGLSLVAIAAACTSSQENVGPPPAPKVTADSSKLEVSTQSLTDVAVTETVVLTNGDATPAQVVGAHWELVFEGNVIAKGDEKVSATVPASGTAEVALHGAGQYAADAPAVLALSDHKGGFLLALRGTLAVQGAGGGSAPVEFAKSTNLREPRLPQVVMQDVGASHYDDGHVNVSFSFAVDNPNPFPVKVVGLDYKVEVNGYTIAQDSKGSGVEVPPSSKKVFEETDELTPEKLKDLADLYQKNAMRYHLTGTLDLGLAKEDVNLEAPILFSR